MSVIQDIVSYINLNPKQVGIKNDNVNIQEVISTTQKINIIDRSVNNKSLYFDIIRECIYRKNINFPSFFNKSQWFSILTENFFKVCIHCNNELVGVNWNCTDIFCNNCKTKYECKSILEYYNHLNKMIHLGQICGVYDFLENDNNVLVIHFLDGYYILPINIFKNGNNIKLIIKNKKTKKSIKEFSSYENFKLYIIENKFIDYQISKDFTVDIEFPSQILIRRYIDLNIDIHTISKEIFEINKVYPCLFPKSNIKSLIYSFRI